MDLYFEGISLVALALLVASVIPTALLKMPFMPSRLQLLERRKEKMLEHTKALLDMERHTAAAEGSRGNKNFLKMLMKCTDEAKD
ncbi:hypothetical protein BJX65DRAFT_291768 [Aspergillus insuetus]